MPDLSLKQCQRWVQPCAGKGRFSWTIRPEKECIKSCESCFANTLNLNDKGPSMKWVCFPKVLLPFIYLTLTQNKPSEFFECYLLFDPYCLTMIDELYVYALYSYANKPNKSPLKNRPFSFERSATFPPQVDQVLVDLFSSKVDRGWGGGLCRWSPTPLHIINIYIYIYIYIYIFKPTLWFLLMGNNFIS